MIGTIRFALPLAAFIAVAGTLIGVRLLAGESAAGSLPAPDTSGKMSLEEAIARRRSVRRFKGDALTRQQIAQLCWAAQGITDPRHGYRASPSAGALYPLELFVVTGESVAHYVPADHSLREHLPGDLRGELQAASYNQSCVGQAAAVFVIAGVVERTQRKYGQRAERYVWMEAGHAGQNILLQAVALGLGGVPVGAYNDQQVAKALRMPPDHRVLYLIPVGKPI